MQVVAQTTRVPLTSIVNSSHCDLLFKLLLREIPCCCCHCGSSGGGGGDCSDGKASEKHGMPSETKTTETTSIEGGCLSNLNDSCYKHHNMPLISAFALLFKLNIFSTCSFEAGRDVGKVVSQDFSGIVCRSGAAQKAPLHVEGQLRSV